MIKKLGAMENLEIDSHVGVVKVYNASKGFGFIELQGEPGEDVYFHKSSIRKPGFQALKPGQKVYFKVTDYRGRQAKDVSLADVEFEYR